MVISFVRHNFLSLIVGALLGSLLVGGPLMDAALSRWDEKNPVWTDHRASVVSSTTGELVVDIVARKMRSCDHRRITAFARTPADPYSQLSIERLDRPMIGLTKPLGVQHVGRFKLSITPPRPFDALVIAENECSGRLVLSTLAEVSMR